MTGAPRPPDGAPWLAAIAIVALVTSYTLVGVVRAHAIRANVMDHPNERSSHREPTPRGGGLGAVIALLLATTVGAASLDRLSWRFGVVGAALTALAAVGWLDDRRSLPVLPRLLTHVAAGVATAWLAALVGVAEPGSAMGLTYLAWWVFWSVSAINVVNFMDGIDGLIASQIALFAGVLALRASPGSLAAVFAVSLAFACAGFLAWNWAPARIFLGDVGSGALGLAAVVAGLLVMADRRVGFATVYLPLLPLFLDATVTIGRRALRGERLTSPHRSHLYQRLANGGWGHARVSVLYLTAAALGGAASLAPHGARALLSAVYAAALLAVGIGLERLAPFDSTLRAQGREGPAGGARQVRPAHGDHAPDGEVAHSEKMSSDLSVRR